MIAKTIAGFLNTEGGNLVIGIRENKGGAPNEIIGIESEYPKLRDPCADGYRRILIDEIIRKFCLRVIPPSPIPISGSFYEMGTIPSAGLRSGKPMMAFFLKIHDDEYFFIPDRCRDPAECGQGGLLDYCRNAPPLRFSLTTHTGCGIPFR